MLALIKDIKAGFANLASAQRRAAAAAASHLSEVPDVEKVEGLKQLAFPHAEHLGARHQEGPDVLQAQKLRWKDKQGSTLAATSEPFCSDSHPSLCAEVNHSAPALSQQVKSGPRHFSDPDKRVTPAAVPLSSGAEIKPGRRANRSDLDSERFTCERRNPSRLLTHLCVQLLWSWKRTPTHRDPKGTKRSIQLLPPTEVTSVPTQPNQTGDTGENIETRLCSLVYVQ